MMVSEASEPQRCLDALAFSGMFEEVDGSGDCFALLVGLRVAGMVDSKLTVGIASARVS